jgi:hypothetical protein
MTACALTRVKKSPIFACNSCHALHKNSRGPRPQTYRNLIKARYNRLARGLKPLKLFPIRAKFLSAGVEAQCLRWKSGAAASNFGKAPIARTTTIVTKAESSARLSKARNAGVLSKSIPLFFIGRNRNGLWIAREAEGRTGGVFLLKQSALHFAQRKSAPVGCATMYLAEPIELDTENLGNPLAKWLDAALSRMSEFIPAYPPAIPIKEKYRKGDWQ